MLCTSTLKSRSLKSSIEFSGCPTQAWQCLGHPDLRIPRKCPRHPGPDKLGFKWVGFGLTSVRFCVALGAALGFAIGVALGVAFGVALGIALGVVFGVALGVVLGVVLSVALGVAFGVGLAFGIFLGIARPQRN